MTSLTLTQPLVARPTSYPFWWMFLVLSTILVVIPTGPLSLGAVVAAASVPVIQRQFRGNGSWPIRWFLYSWIAVVAVTLAMHVSSFRPTLSQLLYPIAIVLVTALFLEVANAQTALLGWLGVAVGIGIALGTLFQPIGIAANQSIIKSGYGIAAALVWFSFCAALSLKPHLRVLGALAISAWLLFSDFRSGAVIVTVAAITSWIGSQPRNLSRGRAAAVVVVGVCVAIGGILGYSAAAEQGILGEEARTRFIEQSSTPGGLFLAGRPELIVSLSAIEGHELFGRGGDPQFSFEERLATLGNLSDAGITLSPANIERVMGSTINSHSLLFGSWVVNGALGVVPWIIFLIAIYLGTYKALRRKSSLSAILAFLSIQLTWDVLFSPWSARGEMIFGLALACAVVELRSSVSRDAPSPV